MNRFSSWWRMHGNALIGLCLLTLMLWQWRFVRCGPNLLAEDACESLTNWIGGETINPAYAKADTEGLVLTKQNNQPSFSLFRQLDDMENVRFVAVTADAAWENAQPHPVIHWLQLRVVITGVDANNHFCAPLDHGVIDARGTRGWHTVQNVVELPPELKKLRLSIDGFGEEGVFRLRNMRVEAVKQRPWFIPATIVLLGMWAFALSRILRPYIHGRWPRSRSFAIACGILLGFWFFVFPQGRTMFPSLMGKFAMGPIIPMVLEPEPEPTPPSKQMAQVDVPKPLPKDVPRAPRLRTIPPPSQQEPKLPAGESVSVPNPLPRHVVTTVAPETRQSTSFFQLLRDIDRHWNVDKYNLTHFSAFFGIGLFVFGLAGSWRIWPLPCTVALLGEIIPNALFNTWDMGDWWDLFANFSGLIVALGIVLLVQRWRRKRASRRLSNPAESFS